MASYYIGQNNLAKAKEKLWDSYCIAANLSDKSQYAIVIEHYGNILNQLQQYDSACFIIKNAFQFTKKKELNRNLCAIYNNLALIFWNNNKRDSTLYYLEKGYNETLIYGNKKNFKTTLPTSSNSGKKSDFAKSNTYLHELVDLKDSVFKNNLVKKIPNIEKDFIVKFKNEENAKLKSEIKQKNTMRNAAIITTILLILLAFYQWRNYKQKRKIAIKEKQIKDGEIDQLLKERELKNLDTLIKGRETERKRIGRNLHNRLGSILSTVKLHFSAIDAKIDTLKNDNQIQYKKASELLDEAVGEVRKIAGGRIGLMPALIDMKNTLEATGKIKLNLFEAGTNIRKDSDFEIAIYRIIQELISNILKHAEATKVDIHITQNLDQFTLIVEDNGKGFNPEPLKQEWEWQILNNGF